MNKVIEYIEDAQQSIFKYNISEITENIGNICNELEDLIKEFEDKDREQLNEILYYINMSLTNKDYLLCADVLEYELKYFLENRVS
ncbi:hypothetical protein [Clostridium grantii]|uniref:Uncharacterized protein n=1 Tax=Clostridium grantii DSM 8605 TaxID=1121316 RepID=A0A1M5W6U1_9CLOT|nr:hypothetical protein [Clostridium grantii]SHH83309.1 hypothetical protein SAMN02745207_02721 [Clostridium grantii DSM 8605]